MVYSHEIEVVAVLSAASRLHDSPTSSPEAVTSAHDHATPDVDAAETRVLRARRPQALAAMRPTDRRTFHNLLDPEAHETKQHAERSGAGDVAGDLW